jgi:hypothetical protein
MIKPRCVICSDYRIVNINRRLSAGDSLRSVSEEFSLSRNTLTRHTGHAELDRPSPVAPPATPTSTEHADAADALVVAFRTAKGERFSPQDSAEALVLQSVAAALDGCPGDVSLLREFRISLSIFRKAFNAGDPASVPLAQFLTEATSKAKEKRP